ncbi:cell division protein FtsK [Escherichia coli]|nr:cell division protein FtsK [Escherichia coli]
MAFSHAFCFPGGSGCYRRYYAGAIFITWSLPEFNDIGNILFAARALLAVSAFVGFCWTAAPDWDDPF